MAESRVWIPDYGWATAQQATPVVTKSAFSNTVPNTNATTYSQTQAKSPAQGPLNYNASNNSFTPVGGSVTQSPSQGAVGGSVTLNLNKGTVTPNAGSFLNVNGQPAQSYTPQAPQTTEQDLLKQKIAELMAKQNGYSDFMNNFKLPVSQDEFTNNARNIANEGAKLQYDSVADSLKSRVANALASLQKRKEGLQGSYNPMYEQARDVDYGVRNTIQGEMARRGLVGSGVEMGNTQMQNLNNARQLQSINQAMNTERTNIEDMANTTTNDLNSELTSLDKQKQSYVAQALAQSQKDYRDYETQQRMMASENYWKGQNYDLTKTQVAGELDNMLKTNIRADKTLDFTMESKNKDFTEGVRQFNEKLNADYKMNKEKIDADLTIVERQIAASAKENALNRSAAAAEGAANRSAAAKSDANRYQQQLDAFIAQKEWEYNNPNLSKEYVDRSLEIGAGVYEMVNNISLPGTYANDVERAKAYAGARQYIKTLPGISSADKEGYLNMVDVKENAPKQPSTTPITKIGGTGIPSIKDFFGKLGEVKKYQTP